MNNKGISLKVVLVTWAILATIYFHHTPPGERALDTEGHIEYTGIICNECRLPKPYDGHETYHPPLYYLINSFIVPVSPNKEKMASLHTGDLPGGLEKHINYVQALSVCYGAIALWIVAWFLQTVTQDTPLQILVLLFIATTPKFVFVFSTYNNDSLVTLLCIAVTALSYKLYHKWCWKYAVFLLMTATAAVYTKYTSLFCMAVIVLMCCKNLLRRKLPGLIEKRIISTIALSIILFTPWMIFHNYHYTGIPITFNFNGDINRQLAFSQIKKTFSTVIKNPLTEKFPHEWDKPWAHSYECPETKHHDYLASSFVNSIIGEYEFIKPGVNYIWSILWLHLLGYIIALTQIFKSNITKAAACFIFFTHLINLASIALLNTPINPCFLDYRYICWSWIGWGILYASASSNKSILSRILNGALIIGISIQIYFLLTVI